MEQVNIRDKNLAFVIGFKALRQRFEPKANHKVGIFAHTGIVFTARNGGNGLASLLNWMQIALSALSTRS